MQRFEHHDAKHTRLRRLAVGAMLLLAGALLMPAAALAQHHSYGHHGGHFGHSSSRYSFGYGHHGGFGGHGFQFGLHQDGHGFSFGHFGGGHRRHSLHHGTARLHGPSHRSGRHHGSRRHHDRHGLGRSHGGYGGHSGYRTGRSYCESVYKRAEVDGRLATIEGLRCYDDHGDPYIVPESREIVEYHDDGYRRR